MTEFSIEEATAKYRKDWGEEFELKERQINFNAIQRWLGLKETEISSGALCDVLTKIWVHTHKLEAETDVH